MHPIETEINTLLCRIDQNHNLKILGLDIGTKKIGVATGHASTKIALPYKVIKANSLKDNVRNIILLCKADNITDIVIGIPYQQSEDSSISSSARYILNLATALASTNSINIYFQDESFSSCAADGLLRETGLTRKKREQLDDAVAASIILDSFFIKLKELQMTL